jgi:phage baseplate assembly protein W
MASTTNHSYIDLDLAFNRHPGTKDVTKKFDSEATKQAIRHIFLTNPFEKPFDPNFGIGLERLLFEQNDIATSITGNFLARRIREMVAYYEPRIVIDDLSVGVPQDENTVNIIFKYHTIHDPIPDSVSFSFRRAR